MTVPRVSYYTNKQGHTHMLTQLSECFFTSISSRTQVVDLQMFALFERRPPVVKRQPYSLVRTGCVTFDIQPLHQSACCTLSVVLPLSPEVSAVCSARHGTVLFKSVFPSAYVNRNPLYAGFGVGLRYATVSSAAPQCSLQTSLQLRALD